MTARPKFSTNKLPKSAEVAVAFRDSFGPQVEMAAIDERGFVYDPEQRLPEWRERKLSWGRVL